MNRLKDLYKLARIKLEYDTLGYYRNVITTGNNHFLLNQLHRSIFNKINVFHFKYNSQQTGPISISDPLPEETQLSDQINGEFVYKMVDFGSDVFASDQIDSVNASFENKFDGFIFSPLDHQNRTHILVPA